MISSHTRPLIMMFAGRPESVTIMFPDHALSPAAPLQSAGHSYSPKDGHHLVKMSNGETWRSHITRQDDRPCLAWGFMADQGLWLSPIL
jgi:hypothetical protein